VQLAQRARLDLDERGGDRRGDGEVGRIDDPDRAAGRADRLLGQQPMG
jgi:hypothetical protein